MSQLRDTAMHTAAPISVGSISSEIAEKNRGFCCCWGTGGGGGNGSQLKETTQPSPLYLHVIYLLPLGCKAASRWGEHTPADGGVERAVREQHLLLRALHRRQHLQAAATVPRAKAVFQGRKARFWPWPVGFKRSAPHEFACRQLTAAGAVGTLLCAQL